MENQLGLIKRSLWYTIGGIILDKRSAKDFLDAIREKFKESDKADIVKLMSSFMNTNYDNVGGVREFIL